MVLASIDQKLESDGGYRLFRDSTSSLSDELFLLHWRQGNWDLVTSMCLSLYVSRFVRRIRRFPVLSYLYVAMFYDFFAPRLARAICREYGPKGITTVWTSSNDIHPIVGAIIAKELGVRFHVSCHDLPHTYLFDSFEKKVISSRIDSWLFCASSMDVATAEMRRFYQSRLEKRIPILVTHSAAGFPHCSRHKRKVPAQIASIVYLGSVRFVNEIEVFLRALHILFHKTGRQINLVVYSGQRLSIPGVVHRGYIDEHVKLMDELKSADLAYSPMSFKADDSLLVRTSFSAKLSTYLCAGLPIFAHGPNYASNVQFVKAHNVGVACDSMDPEILSSALAAYELDIASRVSHARNSQVALKKEFRAVDRTRFFKKYL